MKNASTSVHQDEEREPLAPEHNNKDVKGMNDKDVKVINDLIDDLTRLEGRERIPLGHVMTRVHNNNNRPGPRANILSKQSSLLSSGSRGSGHESVIIDSHSDSRVSPDHRVFYN